MCHSLFFFFFFLDSPKNLTVSASPSGSVLENSNVVLTCNSNANPAEQNYTWYRADEGQETVIGTGKILNIKVSTDKKIFFCKAVNEIGEGHSELRHIDVWCMYKSYHFCIAYIKKTGFHQCW